MVLRKDITTAVVSKDGEITLAEAVFQRYNWDVGTELIIEETPDGVLLKCKPFSPQTNTPENLG